MRNILLDDGLFTSNVAFSGGAYNNSSVVIGYGSFLISLDPDDPLDPTGVAVAFQVQNSGENAALVEVSCHGYFRTLLVNGGDDITFDTKSELALFLATREIAGVQTCTIRVRPANSEEGATVGANAVTITPVATAAGPTSIEMMMLLINDHVVNELSETELLKSEVEFMNLTVDPNDSNYMLLDIQVTREGSPLNGQKRCRYKRALTSVMFPDGVDLNPAPFGVSQINDVLPVINNQTDMTFLPGDFVNDQIAIPDDATVEATLEASNHFLVGQITVNLPEGFDPNNSQNSYFGTNDVIGSVQTNDFQHVFVCDDDNAPPGGTIVGVVAGRNQKVYVVDVGSAEFKTAVYRSRNGAGTWVKHEVDDFESAGYCSFFRGQFYFLARHKETNIRCLMRLVDGNLEDPPTFEYIREVAYPSLSSSLRVFSTDRHICVIYDFVDVAYVQYTLLEYSTNLKDWTVEQIEHGLASDEVRLSGVRAIANQDRVFLFGKAGDYEIGMVTMFGYLGENDWTVDVQPIYPELHQWQISASWSDFANSCAPLNDGRIVLYDSSNSGYGQPSGDRSVGNVHIFDPSASAGSRWTTAFKKSGIDQAKLTVVGTSIALVGKNYSDATWGGGPHANAFSDDNGDNWDYDRTVATFWPYNTIVAIDKRPEISPFIPTMDANTKEELVEHFSVVLEGVGGGNLVKCCLVDAAGKIYVGGTFENFYGRKYLVRLNNDGTLDATFNPTFTSLESFNLTGVTCMALDEVNDVIYVAGPRLMVDGTYPYLAGLNTADGTPLATFPILESSAPWVADIKNLAVGSGGYLYVGGNVTFATPSGVSFVGLGRISSAGVVDETFVLKDPDDRENEFMSTTKLWGAAASGEIIVQPGDAFFRNPSDSGDFYIYPSNILYFGSDGVCSGIPLLPPAGYYIVQYFKLMSDGTMIFRCSDGANEDHLLRVNDDFTQDATFDVNIKTLKHTFVRPFDSYTVNMPYITSITDITYIAADDRFAIVGLVTDVLGKQKIPFTDFCSDAMRPMGYLEVDNTGAPVESKLPIYFLNSHGPTLMPFLGSSRYMCLGGAKFSSSGQVQQYQYWAELNDPRRFVTPWNDLMIVTRED